MNFSSRSPFCKQNFSSCLYFSRNYSVSKSLNPITRRHQTLLASKLSPNEFYCKNCNNITTRNPRLNGHKAVQEYCRCPACQRARRKAWAMNKYNGNDKFRATEIKRSQLNRDEARNRPPPAAIPAVLADALVAALRAELAVLRQIITGMIAVNTNSHVAAEVQVTMTKFGQRGLEVSGLVQRHFDTQ